MATHESRVRRSRALGIALTPKAARYMEKRPSPPGQHGAARRRSKTLFGEQLLEKQRLRYSYNISDSTLRSYYRKAIRKKGSTPDNLMRLLEGRLDIFILRAGFAPTIYAARQFVTHGHVVVNGKKVNVPGYAVKPLDAIALTERAKKILLIQETMKNAQIPPYIEVNKENMSASLIRVPEPFELPTVCKVPMVVEFYLR